MGLRGSLWPREEWARGALLTQHVHQRRGQGGSGQRWWLGSRDLAKHDHEVGASLEMGSSFSLWMEEENPVQKQSKEVRKEEESGW